MKTITWYMTKQVLGTAILATIVLCFVVWLFRSLQIVDMMLNRGLTISTFLYFASLQLPRFLLFVAPMAMFGAAVFTYNKMISDSELVVLRSSGLSQFALAKPAIIVALLISAASFYLSLYLVPVSYREFKVLEYKLRADLPKLLLEEGVFTPFTDGITVFFRSVGPEGELVDVLIHDDRDRREPKTWAAREGRLEHTEEGKWIVKLKQGSLQVMRDRGHLPVCPPGATEAGNAAEACKSPHFEFGSFDEGQNLDIEFITDGERQGMPRPRERFIHELLNPDTDDPRHQRDMLAEAHNRLTTPLLPLTCTMVGIAILLSGSFNRRGQFKLVMMAIIAAAAIIIFGHMLRNYAVRIPALNLVMYLNVALPLLASLFIILVPRRMHRPASSPTF